MKEQREKKKITKFVNCYGWNWESKRLKKVLLFICSLSNMIEEIALKSAYSFLKEREKSK